MRPSTTGLNPGDGGSLQNCLGSPRGPAGAQTHPARWSWPTWLRKKCRLSAWSFFIRGTMVQLGFRPLLRTACVGHSRLRAPSGGCCPPTVHTGPHRAP